MTTQPPRSMGDIIRDSLPIYEAPEELRAWARAQAAQATHATQTSDGARELPRARHLRSLQRLAYAAGLVIAASTGWIGNRYYAERSKSTGEQRMLLASIVDTHVRSLMADHLTDVLSSDHHTVKPWFAGKVDFAPTVPELQSSGFPLIGGRVEIVSGHTAAALVYGRGPHKINLFIWPSSSTADAGPPAAWFNGYALVHWSDRGLTYWAVTDAAASELSAFERAYRAAGTT
jgi:anti-sigma factor RsiW